MLRTRVGLERGGTRASNSSTRSSGSNRMTRAAGRTIGEVDSTLTAYRSARAPNEATLLHDEFALHLRRVHVALEVVVPRFCRRRERDPLNNVRPRRDFGHR